MIAAALGSWFAGAAGVATLVGTHYVTFRRGRLRGRDELEAWHRRQHRGPR